jgi:phosphonate degradation associated HDIG domain protein
MRPLEQILDVLRRGGGDEYGSDGVSQLEHALQCATLAEAAGASAPLIIAALLHDVGHLVHPLGHDPARRGIDDRHEVRGRDWLGRWFAEDVTGPVRLHVDAKRYLCAVDPSYFAALSAGSVRSLALQGGPFPLMLARGFIGLPHAAAAVQLRRWDEGAKVPGRPTADLDHFRPYLEANLRVVA